MAPRKSLPELDDVIRIDGRFYDTQRLAAIHPGGDIFVLMANRKDGTALFNMSHRRAFPHERYADYEVTAAPAIQKAHFAEEYNQDFTLYYQICEAIKPIIAKTRGFAPWHYFVKVAFLVLGLLACDLYLLFVERSYSVALLCGLFAAGIGLNVQHDANHGAVSRNPRVNRMLGLTQDLIGGCGLMWMVKHNTIHHVTCNDPDRDVDLAIPFLRLHGKAHWVPPHVMQSWYFTILEAMFGPVHLLFNWYLIITGPKGGLKVLAEHWQTHRLLLIFSIIRIGGGLYLHPSWHTVGQLFALYSFGGLYLAFFFLLSHNFVGVRKDDVDCLTGCFVKHQAETSSNVGGWLLTQTNGGLNYQIEHHLFPRVHHSYYPYIAPVVRRMCRGKKIRYTHFPWVWDNAISTFKHMAELGQQPVKQQ